MAAAQQGVPRDACDPLMAPSSRMMPAELARKIRGHDWFAVLVELAVVILGIVIAFQIDRWREFRADRVLEASYVRRLLADIETDIPRIEHAVARAAQRKRYAELLMAVSKDPGAAAADPARFLVALEAAAWTHTPALATYSFDDLRATGRLNLIRSEEIARALSGYYGFDQSERQYLPLNLATEQHYFELVAGVLDHDQANWVVEFMDAEPSEDVEVRLRQAQVDPTGVLAAAERLRARQAVVDWLPALRNLQMEHQYSNNRRLQLARDLLEELRKYSGRIDAAGAPAIDETP